MSLRPHCSFVYLGLGSNLGDRLGHLSDALEGLAAAGVRVRRVSPWLETRFVGPGPPQPDYLNAVAEVETGLVPLALLELTQSLEVAAGRAPGTHLLPRPLDIDMLLYRDWCVQHPRLVLPHPRLLERRFVLESLAALGVLQVRPAWLECLARLRETQHLTTFHAPPTEEG